MKSIILSTRPDKVKEVYSEDVINKLIAIADLDYGKVYDKHDLLEEYQRFENVEYIFSTWFMPKFSQDEIRKYFPNLKSVFYAAGNTDYFKDSFVELGIDVYDASSVNAIPVAEFVVAQIVLANKGYFQSQRIYKKPFYKLSFRRSKLFSEIKGGNYKVKVGIVGAGVIGKRILNMLKNYNLQTFVCDPYITEEEVKDLGSERLDIEDLLEVCDVISNHLPDVETLKGYYDYDKLKLMKETSTFINTGRGHHVVESDLCKILKLRPNMCAILDVSCREPILPMNSLLRRKNVFLTPHIAGSIGREQERMAIKILNDYLNIGE